MTIGNNDLSYVETLLDGLDEDERQTVLAKYSDGSAIEVVDKNPENALYGVYYQQYGLNAGDFLIIQEYLVNGFNKTQAYRTVYPDSNYAKAQTLSSRKFQEPKVWQFVNDVLERMGISNAELERRIESYLHFDPLQFYKLETRQDKKGKEYSEWVFDIEEAKKAGVGRFIKGIKPGRYGLELQFHDAHKFYDLLTKVRGLQKDVSIITDLKTLAEQSGVPIDKLNQAKQYLADKAKERLSEGKGLPMNITVNTNG